MATTPSPYDANLRGTVPRIRPVPRLKYRWTGLRKVGTAISLFYGFAVFVAFHHARNIISHGDNSHREYGFFAGLLFPLAGYLADVHVNRYKLIRSGMFVMWISSLLIPIVYLPSVIQTPYAKYSRIVAWLLFGLGTCCGQANLIQFGMDQLKDSSSREIIAYIKWYVWTYFASMVVVGFTQVCVQYSYTWISLLYLPVLFSIALCIDFLFNHHLVKECTTQNPLPLIYGVLKYAVRNRYPQLRSSYMYWNNRCCSRINLAKSSFGGPYTSQQVEDVKSFFQICILALLGGVFLSVNSAFDWIIIRSYVKIPLLGSIDISCLINSLYFKGGYIAVTLFIPVCECVIFPLVRSYLPYFKILVRVSVGGVTCLLYLALISVFVLSKKLHFCLSYNTCKVNPLYWFVFLSISNCAGLYITITAGMEFVCAQCPSNMKGIIIGLFYFFYSASLASVLKIDEKVCKLQGRLCVVLTHMFIAVAIAGVFCVSVLLYKARQRDQKENIITDVM